VPCRIRRLFPPAGNRGFRWPDCAGRTHATDLIDKRGWISKEDYVEGLGIGATRAGSWQPNCDLSRLHSCRLARRNGSWRGVRSAFIPDGAGASAAMFALAVPWMQGMFYGIGAAVIRNHRPLCVQTHQTHSREGQIAGGFLPCLQSSTAWTREKSFGSFCSAE